MRGTTIRRLLATVLGGAAVSAVAAPPADLDALVSYETRQVTASGVTRVDSWTERLVRRGNTVWTERVLPPHSAQRHGREEPAEHAGHKHFNAEAAARWLSVGTSGQLELKFVDHEHKLVVSVPRAEYGSVGFDGRFEAATSIVPASVARQMKAQGGATRQGQWRIEHGGGWTHRVLWAEDKQIALRTESQRDDGGVRRVVTVRLQPATPAQALPWSHLAAYETRNYGDFMD